MAELQRKGNKKFCGQCFYYILEIQKNNNIVIFILCYIKYKYLYIKVQPRIHCLLLLFSE